MIFHTLIAASVLLDMETIYLEITSPRGNWIKLKSLESYPEISSFNAIFIFFSVFSVFILAYTAFQVQNDERRQELLKKVK